MSTAEWVKESGGYEYTPEVLDHAKDFEYTYPDEGDIISELLCITGELKGEMQRLTCVDSTGRQSKKIIIEYDVKQKGE